MKITSNIGNFEIEHLYFNELEPSEKEGVSDNGSGKEYASYLKVTHDNKVIVFESDAMESEDAIFSRDLAWIMKTLVKCYTLGHDDGYEDGYDNGRDDAYENYIDNDFGE